MSKEVHAVVYGVQRGDGTFEFTIEPDPTAFLTDGFVYDSEEGEWLDREEYDDSLIEAVYEELFERLQ